MLTGHPALDQQGEQTLEFGAVLRAIAQHVEGMGFLRQQVRQEVTNHFISIELIERRVDFDIGGVQSGFAQLAYGCFGGVLLTAQVTTQAAIKAHTQFAKMAAQYFGLAHTDGR